MYKILLSGDLKKSYQIDPKNCWLLAAAEKNLPMFVPGWEDATLGNMYAGHCISGDVKKVHTVRTGIEYMMELAEWYTKTTADSAAGILPDRRRHRGRFPDLRRADAAPGSAARERAAVGLLLPDLRLDHELRLVFRRRAQREDHLGQAGRDDAEVHRRERCVDRGAADVRLCAGVVRTVMSGVGHFECAVNPSPPNFSLTPSFHSQKTFAHFAGNYPLAAHNGIVIETSISPNVRLAHANSASTAIAPLSPILTNLYQ